MAVEYNKPHRTYREQLAILKRRGLAVGDVDEAVRWLSSAGYYVLGSYLYTMREATAEDGRKVVEDRFIDGASFEHMIDLYRFDRQLRLLCIDALEVIEKATKTRLAYRLGRLDRFPHRSGALHRQPGGEQHMKWLEKHDEKLDRHRDAPAGNLVKKYGEWLPIWIAIDVMDFGDVSHLFALLQRDHQDVIAAEFSISSGPLFASWVRALCHTRNIAAHHGRLWNRVLIDAPKKPSRANRASLGGLGSCLRDDAEWKRLYPSLCVMSVLIRQIDPTSSWPSRMAAHLETLPIGVGVDFRDMGAPADWRDDGVWGS